METCERCDVGSEEVKLFDAIYEGRMVNLCERCSIVENIPIIKKPDASQLKESEQTIKVYDRMKRMSGLRDPEKEDTYFQEDRLKELDSNPKLELPEKNKLNLIEHFHWEVMKNRRRRGMSQQQLAKSIGESEIAIEMIEKAKLPENAEAIIRKLEQIFQTRLRKISEYERLRYQKAKEPVLLDEKGNELEIIPDEEPIIIESEDEEETKEEINSKSRLTSEKEIECRIKPFNAEKQKMTCETVEKPRLDNSGYLDIKKTNTNQVTIGELKKIHEKKAEEDKQKELEEQKKVEERKRILLELRERDRLKYEQKKQQEILERQEQEQEKRQQLEKKQQELEQKKDREFKDIDKYLGGTELLNKNKEKSTSIENSKSVKEFDDVLR